MEACVFFGFMAGTRPKPDAGKAVIVDNTPPVIEDAREGPSFVRKTPRLPSLERVLETQNAGIDGQLVAYIPVKNNFQVLSTGDEGEASEQEDLNINKSKDDNDEWGVDGSDKDDNVVEQAIAVQGNEENNDQVLRAFASSQHVMGGNVAPFNPNTNWFDESEKEEGNEFIEVVTFQVVFDSINCVLTAVYARTSIVERRRLWLDIEDIKCRFVSGPWIVVGDFNVVLGAHEKKGGAPVSRLSCEEFQAMSDICELIHVDTKGAQFTWARRRGVRGNVELRLDRCLVNLHWLDSWDSFTCSTLPRLCSDHNPLLITFSKSAGVRRSRFRFQKMWLEHKDFHAFVKLCWGSSATYGCPLTTLQHKLRVLRKALRSWNWEVFGDVNRRVDHALAELEALQLSIANSGGSEVDFAKEMELQANLTDSLRVQESFLQEKSRLRWLTEGDRNSSFFQTMCRIRKAQSSITYLKAGDRVLEDPDSIKNHIVDYYMNLFSNQRGCQDTGLVTRTIPSLVTELENEKLIALPSHEEVLSAVKGMDSASAPGPDGFNGYFFVSCWDIVGDEVVAAVQYFFRFDCIMSTSECFNLLDNKCYGGNVAIKVDITKAFDTLSWDFLLSVLQAFGFHQVFLGWIKALLHSAKLSLLVNGSSEGYFSCGRGVRQGDPLSPLLFCLAEEVLSRGIDNLVITGQVHTISSPRGVCVPSHVLFADDVMVFCRGDQRSLNAIMQFFEEYGLNSGQIINRAKSSVFISKHIQRRQQSIVSSLGMKLGSTPFTYLGVPIFRGKPRSSYFQPITDKIRVRFSSWKGSMLSMAGRLQLIMSTIYSMLIHSFQVYQWPISLLRRLEVWCRNFLWSGSIDAHGVPLVAWKQCCSPLDEGGVGLKQLRVLNFSLLLKKAWDVFTSVSDGCTLLRTRFWRNGKLRRSYATSSIWPGVKHLWPHILENGKWLIGNGRRVLFWKDNFIGRPLYELFGLHDREANQLNILVADYISNGAWNFPTILQLHFPGVCDFVKQNVSISLSDHEDDQFIWTPSASGVLSARDAYNFLRPKFAVVSWGKLLWKNFIPPRMSLLAWKILKGHVLSEEFLQKRGISMASRCSLCHRHGESLEHIFLSCSFASNQARFDGVQPNVNKACNLIFGQVVASNKISSGCMNNGVFDLSILKNVGVPCKPSKAPCIVEVNWHPPLFGWVKVNTDGAWRSSSGQAGYGGLFRDFRGGVLGAFCSNFNMASSVAAEVMAVIKAIELAWVRDWKHVWLEVDSSLVINFLR
ncbi:hypothetical protein ACLB2K_037063 [Fragaria x ananassa]